MIYKLDERLRIERAKRHLSQRQVAESVCVDKSTISSYENGNATPPAEMLIKLSDFYNISVDYLLGVEKTKTISVVGLSDKQINSLMAVVDAFKETNDADKN